MANDRETFGGGLSPKLSLYRLSATWRVYFTLLANVKTKNRQPKMSSVLRVIQWINLNVTSDVDINVDVTVDVNIDVNADK